MIATWENNNQKKDRKKFKENEKKKIKYAPK